MSKNSEKDGKLNNMLEYGEARKGIKDQVKRSKERLTQILDLDEVEKALKAQAEEKHKALESHRRERRSKKAEDTAGEEDVKLAKHHEKLTVYKARTSLLTHEDVPEVDESFIHRSVRLAKSMHAVKKELKKQPLLSAEKRRSAKQAVFSDCYEPYVKGWNTMLDTLWAFLVSFCNDFFDALLYVADCLIVVFYYLRSILFWIGDLLLDLRFWFDEHKYSVFQVFAGTITASALIAVFVSSLVGYEYSYYGKTLGIAKSRQDVYQTIEVLGDKLSEATGANVSLDVERDIQFTRVWGGNLEIDSKDDILNTLTYMKDIQVQAYAISVDDRKLVFVETEAKAQGILDSIIARFSEQESNAEYVSIGFAENVNIEEVSVQLGDIWNESDAISYLLTGSAKPVSEEQVFSLIHVATTTMVTEYELINYGTRYINNPNLYADEVELITEGVYGQQKLVSEVQKINGVEQSRTVVSSVKLSNPVDEVMYQGTKAIPVREGTGTFNLPVKTYTLSSRFGWRWGRMHEGLDFACSTGSKVYASDGGTVTFAGWHATYGNLVIIDHGGLYTTRYAHNSKLLVKEGDKVYQGQNIALSGNTGRSTGPHCHFEIRYNGSALNPINYLTGL